MNDIGQSAGKNLAWLAGVIEGDGMISLQKQKMGKERIIFTPIVSFTNTDHFLVEEVGNIFSSFEVGHFFTSRKTKNGTAKNVSVKGFKRVEKLLNILTEFLRGKKKEQAILLLEWINSRRITGNSNTYTTEEMKLFDRIKELKKPD